MSESIMYCAIGFLAAALFGLLCVPLIHNRAVRLTARRLDAATPQSIIEVRADKDRLRSQFAMSIRRLEISIEEMKTKTAEHLVEISNKTNTINGLKKELDEKTGTILSLETGEKTLRSQLSSVEKVLEARSSSLHEAEASLTDKVAELAKQGAVLADKVHLLDARECEIEQLREKLDGASKLKDRRRGAVFITRRQNLSRSVAELHSEIDRLEAELYAVVETRANQQREIEAMRDS